MTKYILVGGHPYKASDGGRAFAENLTEGFPEPVKLLDCLFARPQADWENAYRQDQEFFQKHLPGRTLVMALADVQQFRRQIQWAHTIYLRGGSTDTLRALLRQIGDWEVQLNGKTLAGSSAGADIIAKYYYGLDDLKLGDGLGLLPVKVLVHYRSDYNAPHIDWEQAYRELKNYKEDLPILTLAEGQFMVTAK
ncbi:MAG: Type 1 glutamine amidotransferase-like domain-containing protein [bacterium]|nr:Type 1 glutamine amidotransferase-like domain-containing protein [bacterium]MDZ4296222.1 Type 1 glutamine amidotransferase-like domain-containing protein [Patescibacteria group bacterium]